MAQIEQQIFDITAVDADKIEPSRAAKPTATEPTPGPTPTPRPTPAADRAVRAALETAERYNEAIRDIAAGEAALLPALERNLRAIDDNLARRLALSEGSEELQQRAIELWEEETEAAIAAAAAVESLGDASEDAGARTLASWDQASAGLRSVQEVAEETISGMDRALTDFVFGGKTSFSDLINHMIREFARLLVFQPALDSLAGFIGGLFGGGGRGFRGPGGLLPTGPSGYPSLHGGGIAGQLGGVRRRVAPEIFAAAPRLHGGGIAGDEVPTLLRKGEGVFTPEQMQALGGMAAPRIEIRFENRGTPQREVSRDVPLDGRGIVIGLLVDDLERRGPVSRGLESRYGLRPRA